MPSSAPPSIGFVSLGCPKNLVDSERILTQMRAEGYALVDNYADADLVVVNTCGFIDAAVAESLETIGDALQQNGKVIVTGCLGERADTIRAQFPHVLAITGAHAYDAVMEQVHKHLPPSQEPFVDLLPTTGIKLTPKHYAYVKISEGCNHRCAFCIIPQLRGDLVSRPVDAVLREAEALVAGGVRELLIVSQDTSAYGVDTKYKSQLWKDRVVQTRLRDLARELGQLQAWIRMHYVYPYPHVDDLIPMMAEGLILPYLDMPLQHGSASILKAMQRPAATEKVLERLKRWRSICPELTLRSTFIVGFPGETEADFQQLLDFLQEAQLDRVGCFAYSPVSGATANALPDPVPESLKQERLEQFMAAQERISRDKLSTRIGTQQIVLIDEVHEQEAIARTQFDAPEVDGVVLIEGAWDLQPGDFIEVTITAADAHDLVGEPITE
jgi:ribosomal protein S12 methylthiotransferase